MACGEGFPWYHQDLSVQHSRNGTYSLHSVACAHIFQDHLQTVKHPAFKIDVTFHQSHQII